MQEIWIDRNHVNFCILHDLLLCRILRIMIRLSSLVEISYKKECLESLKGLCFLGDIYHDMELICYSKF